MARPKKDTADAVNNELNTANAVKSENNTATAVQPKKTGGIIYSGDREFDHHLFKLEVATMQKNTAWKKYKPELMPVEHCHNFRSTNQRGEAQKYSNAIGGHFHEVTWAIDENGTPVAQTGPALHEVLEKLPSGRLIKVVRPVAFLIETNDGVQSIPDDHSHECTYWKTDRLSANLLRSLIKQDTDKYKNMLKMQQKPAPKPVPIKPRANEIVDSETEVLG